MTTQVIYCNLIDPLYKFEIKNMKCEESLIRAVRTGEFRPPIAGEWFISGYSDEAMRAYSNLNESHQIAKLVEFGK